MNGWAILCLGIVLLLAVGAVDSWGYHNGWWGQGPGVE